MLAGLGTAKMADMLLKTKNEIAFLNFLQNSYVIGLNIRPTMSNYSSTTSSGMKTNHAQILLLLR